MTEEEAFASEAVHDPDGVDTFDSKKGKMLWCLHCERAYSHGWHRKVHSSGMEYHMCPYEGCDGDVVMDAWTWEKVRSGNEGYPEKPELGKRYPLYGDDDD
jgi:hypothetical protein